MKSRKRAGVIAGLFLVVLAAGVYYAARSATWHALAQQPVRVTPFTIEQITLSYVRNPGGDLLERRITARRSDGSQAYYGTLAGVPAPVRKVELAEGQTTTLLDSLRMKVSTFFGKENIARRKEALLDPPPSCCYPYEELLGTERVAGVETRIVRRSLPGLQLTEWRAVQLQCFAVQSRSEKVGGSQTQLQAETKPLWLVMGEPQPALFDTGGSYAEMAPSQFRRALYAAMGITERDCPICFDTEKERAEDKLYLAHRQGQ